MQLLVEPALDADGLQMRRAGCVDAEGEAIEQDQVMRRQIGRVGCGDLCAHHHDGAAQEKAYQAVAELA